MLCPDAGFAAPWRGAHWAAGGRPTSAVIVGGLTALPVALASEAAAPVRAGLFAQGVVWLALLVVAVTAIRRGEIARHARFLLAMAAVASGGIWPPRGQLAVHSLHPALRAAQ